MIVIHAVWIPDGDGALQVWAESSVLPLTAPIRRGRQPKTPGPRPHPFHKFVCAGTLEERIDLMIECTTCWPNDSTKTRF